MPRLDDLSPRDPLDPFPREPGDGLAPPSSLLERHPYVRRLQRELARLTAENAQLQSMQREMVRKDVIAARHLEPLNPAPRGVLAPLASGPTIVHVDTLRLLRNRVMGLREPIIRILRGGRGGQPLHSRSVTLLGPSQLRELYEFPLPGRPSAIAVLETFHDIDVIG